MATVILAVSIGALMLLTAYLGVHVTLHPADSGAMKTRYKLGFCGCAVAACALIGVQAYLNNRAQAALEKHVSQVELNTKEPPKVQVTNNVPPAQVFVAGATDLKAITDEVITQMRSAPRAAEQRYLPEQKIGDMVKALWLAKGYRAVFVRGGSFEAEGFAAQLRLVLTAAQWSVTDGTVFPPQKPEAPMFVEGPMLSDPGVLALQSAFTIAGYSLTYRKGGADRMVTLYF